jgi:hypothetical protein
MKSKTNWLHAANELLSSFENMASLKSSKQAENIFIIGAPRSGTTLLSQCLAGCFDVGYVDNLMASFWKAPTFGTMLSNKLIRNRLVSGTSNFGETQMISDPHEFGAFWRDALGYSDMNQDIDKEIDCLKVLEKLDQIAYAFGKPVVYKVFQLFWHLSTFHDARPNTKWIWITRDIEENARSILELRRKKGGDINKWISAKPVIATLFDNESNKIQAVSQVIGINEWIRTQLSMIERSSWLSLDYDEFAVNPQGAVSLISEFLNLEISPDSSKRFCETVSVSKPVGADAEFASAIELVQRRLKLD